MSASYTKNNRPQEIKTKKQITKGKKVYSYLQLQEHAFVDMYPDIQLISYAQDHVHMHTVKLCYSDSGRPRHIFSLLPSSRYSQMTNLPRETKGNNLGTGAVDIRFLLDAIS